LALLDDLTVELELYVAARTKILEGQSVDLGGLRLQRADLKFVQTHINQLRARVDSLSNSKGSRRAVVLRRP